MHSCQCCRDSEEFCDRRSEHCGGVLQESHPSSLSHRCSPRQLKQLPNWSLDVPLAFCSSSLFFFFFAQQNKMSFKAQSGYYSFVKLSNHTRNKIQTLSRASKALLTWPSPLFYCSLLSLIPSTSTFLLLQDFPTYFYLYLDHMYREASHDFLSLHLGLRGLRGTFPDHII